jgi:hypothetical protein
VVYSASGDDNEMEVWRLDLADSPRSQSLGYRRADVLATRKGELALSQSRASSAASTWWDSS